MPISLSKIFKEYLFTIFLLVGIILIQGCKESRKADQIKSPAGERTHLPYLTSTDGNLFLSWIEEPSDTALASLKFARYEAGNWSSPETITSGDDWFVNWADYPSIVGMGKSLLAAHWLHKIPGNTYSYEVKMKMSNGNKDTVLTPHFDQTATEHGFVSMVPWSENSVMAVWLDGRQTADRAEDEYGDLTKAMTVRSAIIHSNGRLTNRQLIDNSVCDCCQTSLAKTQTGAIAAYRNRTSDEIRDIYVSRYEDGKWTQPVPVNNDKWKIGGCPVNGPRIKASGDTVAVAWFTGANDSYKVKATYSFDGGKSFSDPIRLDEGNPIGRVDIDFATSQDIVVSWMEKVEDKAALKYRVIDTNTSQTGNAQTISMMAPDRKSGFPQMEIFNGQMVFAWTDISEQPQIKMAANPLQSVSEQ